MLPFCVLSYKYNSESHDDSLRMAGHGDDLLEEGWGFTPKCQMDDAERFRGCLPLTVLCSACGEVRVSSRDLPMW